MASVPVSLQIDESVFVSAIRQLRSMQGVTKVEFDLDLATKKRPTASRANGAMTLQQVIVAILAKEGPQHASSIKHMAMQAGFKPSGVSGQLTELKQKGIVISAGVGMHRLTEHAQREMQAEHVERPALPAPEKKSRRNGAQAVVLDAMKKSGDDYVTREALMDALRAKGMVGRSLGNALTRCKTNGLVKSGPTKGTYVLTPKGRKFEVPQEGN